MTATYISVMKALDDAGLCAHEELRSICMRIDECCVDFGCERLEVLADPVDASLELTLFFDDIIMEHGRKHPFFEAIKTACMVEFSAKDDLPVVKIQYTNLSKN